MYLCWIDENAFYIWCMQDCFVYFNSFLINGTFWLDKSALKFRKAPFSNFGSLLLVDSDLLTNNILLCRLLSDSRKSKTFFNQCKVVCPAMFTWFVLRHNLCSKNCWWNIQIKKGVRIPHRPDHLNHCKTCYECEGFIAVFKWTQNAPEDALLKKVGVATNYGSFKDTGLVQRRDIP